MLAKINAHKVYNIWDGKKKKIFYLFTLKELILAGRNFGGFGGF